jgi:hypothetical protein
MEFKEKIKTINMSKISVTPIYKKIDTMIERIQHDKDRGDAAQERIQRMQPPNQNRDFFMRPVKSLPKEFMDRIYGEVKDIPKPDLDIDIPRESLFNYRVNPAQAPTIGITPEEHNKIKYSVDNANR